MPTWTLSMRMTLHCLFATHKYGRTDDDWWRIWTSIHGTSRERQKVYDDYSQRESETRSTMYRKQILKPTRSYTPEESQTWSNVHAEVARHAKKLNIALPAQKKSNSADGTTEIQQRNDTEEFRRDDSAPSSSSRMNPTQGAPMASYPSGPSTSPPKLEKRPSSSAMVPQSSGLFYQQSKPEDGKTKRKTTDTPTTDPSEPARKKRMVSEASGPGVLAPATKKLVERLTRHFSSLRINEAFQQWEENTMNRIIWKPITRQTSIGRGGVIVASTGPLPSAEKRLISYCASVFGDRFGSDEQAVLKQSLPEGWTKDGKLLHQYEVWDRVFPDPQERARLLKRLLPFSSFSGVSKPFPNFQIAITAFGQGLQMYHYTDVKWKGHRGGQPVLGAVNTKPMTQITCIERSDPVFKRGGRVYSIRVDQPNALGVMGINPKEGMASIWIDGMLCDPLFCAVCNPTLKDSSADIRTSTGLPRVHARFLKSGNVFTFGDVKNKNDHDEQFIHDVKSGVVEVTFWDQHKEDAIICDRSSCAGCIEYAQLWV